MRSKRRLRACRVAISGELNPVALESFPGGLKVDAGGADGVAAKLAPALYLAYKYHSQFLKLKDVITAEPGWTTKHKALDRGKDPKNIIENWTAAQVQDSSKPEVWRKLARFAALLRSSRIKR